MLIVDLINFIISRGELLLGTVSIVELLPFDREFCKVDYGWVISENVSEVIWISFPVFDDKIGSQKCKNLVSQNSMIALILKSVNHRTELKINQKFAMLIRKLFGDTFSLSVIEEN